MHTIVIALCTFAYLTMLPQNSPNLFIPSPLHVNSDGISIHPPRRPWLQH